MVNHHLADTASFSDRLVVEMFRVGHRDEILQEDVLQEIYSSPVAIHEIDG